MPLALRVPALIHARGIQGAGGFLYWCTSFFQHCSLQNPLYLTMDGLRYEVSVELRLAWPLACEFARPERFMYSFIYLILLVD